MQNPKLSTMILPKNTGGGLSDADDDRLAIDAGVMLADERGGRDDGETLTEGSGASDGDRDDDSTDGTDEAPLKEELIDGAAGLVEGDGDRLALAAGDEEGEGLRLEEIGAVLGLTDGLSDRLGEGDGLDDGKMLDELRKALGLADGLSDGLGLIDEERLGDSETAALTDELENGDGDELGIAEGDTLTATDGLNDGDTDDELRRREELTGETTTDVDAPRDDELLLTDEPLLDDDELCDDAAGAMPSGAACGVRPSGRPSSIHRLTAAGPPRVLAGCRTPPSPKQPESR